jgi:SAM-dependent methyltransferase
MAISEEEVIWGYRMILGREPESVDAVHANMGSVDLHHLHNRFLGSEEFLLKRKNYALEIGKVAQDSNSNQINQPIEYEATLNQLVDCTAKVVRDNECVRPFTPHYVHQPLSTFEDSDIDKNVEDYWSTGIPVVQELISTLGKYNFTEAAVKTVVEYGCEVGTVSFALSHYFKKVNGYDSSSGLVRLANKKANELSRLNCVFHEGSRNPFSIFEPCDLFYSKDALKSLPPPLILQTIRNALRSLKSGGVAVFELPTSLAGYSFSIKEWLQAEKSLEETTHCLPQQPVFAITQENACEVLEVSEKKDSEHRLISNRFIIRKINNVKAKKLVLPVFLSQH